LSERGPGDLQHQAEHARSRPRPPHILSYLVILFAVAFLLLLMAFFQQRRAASETSDALKQSVSAVQSIQQVMDDNRALTEENAALKAQVDRLTQANGGLADDLSGAQTALDQARQEEQAMQWFWQIESAYVKGRWSLCRDLIDLFQAENGLVEALPEENTTGTSRFSPAARYAEICEALY